ncbi:PE family protein [Mycobacterium angelicum]|nr:PE family protein [Mycobacterium angelicum]MCV7199448.1 PE family protein [Mycobacterium angelicum]
MPRVLAMPEAVGATTCVTGPATDEFSAHLAEILNGQWLGYQAFSAQTAVLHDGFMTALNASAPVINAAIRTLLDR